MIDPVLAQLVALKGATANALKVKWRALFDTDPNRKIADPMLWNIQDAI
jgi:hypothetical protein